MSHSDLFFKLRDVGIGGFAFDVRVSFLSGGILSVMVNCVRREDVRVVSGLPQGSVLGPLMFLLYTRDISMISENAPVGYADNSTLLAEGPKPSNKVSYVLSFNHDLARLLVIDVNAWIKNTRTHL